MFCYILMSGAMKLQTKTERSMNSDFKNDFRTQMDKMPEAQVQFEIVRGGYDKILAKIENGLRGRVMEARNASKKLSVPEMVTMLEEAMHPEYGQVEIYSNGIIKNLPDDATYFTFSCDLHKFYLWIYIRAI